MLRRYLGWDEGHRRALGPFSQPSATLPNFVRALTALRLPGRAFNFANTKRLATRWFERAPS